jgi:hypothetical protein
MCLFFLLCYSLDFEILLLWQSFALNFALVVKLVMKWSLIDATVAKPLLSSWSCYLDHFMYSSPVDKHQTELNRSCTGLYVGCLNPCSVPCQQQYFCVLTLLKNYRTTLKLICTYSCCFSVQKKPRKMALSNLERIQLSRQVFYPIGISVGLWLPLRIVDWFSISKLCLTCKLFAKSDPSEKGRRRNKQNENDWRSSGCVNRNWSKVLPHSDRTAHFNQSTTSHNFLDKISS